MSVKNFCILSCLQLFFLFVVGGRGKVRGVCVQKKYKQEVNERDYHHHERVIIISPTNVIMEDNDE